MDARRYIFWTSLPVARSRKTRDRPVGNVLEVGSLYAYIHQYRGGLRDEQGTLLIRDMEGMISLIARHCSEALGVPVQVRAKLAIAPKQEMRISI